MVPRSGLRATIAGLSLGACNSQYPHASPEDASRADSLKTVTAIRDSSPSEEKHIHREYGVFATDDAPVKSPELADVYFEGMRLAAFPYHDYSSDTRIRGEEFRIGQLPNGILGSGATLDLVQRLYNAVGGTGSEKDLRMAIIFTGEEFVSGSKEALRDIPSTTTKLGRQEFQAYKTDVGLFYRTISPTTLGILICGVRNTYLWP